MTIDTLYKLFGNPPREFKLSYFVLICMTDASDRSVSFLFFGMNEWVCWSQYDSRVQSSTSDWICTSSTASTLLPTTMYVFQVTLGTVHYVHITPVLLSLCRHRLSRYCIFIVNMIHGSNLILGKPWYLSNYNVFPRSRSTQIRHHHSRPLSLTLTACCKGPSPRESIIKLNHSAMAKQRSWVV